MRVRRTELVAFLAEDRCQAGEQLRHLAGAQRQVAAAHQAHAARLNAEQGRIGTQPGVVAGIAGIGLAGQCGGRPLPGWQAEQVAIQALVAAIGGTVATACRQPVGARQQAGQRLCLGSIGRLRRRQDGDLPGHRRQL